MVRKNPHRKLTNIILTKMRRSNKPPSELRAGVVNSISHKNSALIKHARNVLEQTKTLNRPVKMIPQGMDGERLKKLIKQK